MFMVTLAAPRAPTYHPSSTHWNVPNNMCKNMRNSKWKERCQNCIARIYCVSRRYMRTTSWVQRQGPPRRHCRNIWSQKWGISRRSTRLAPTSASFTSRQKIAFTVINIGILMPLGQCPMICLWVTQSHWQHGHCTMHTNHVLEL